MAQDCPFCLILDGVLPSREVYSDEHIYAFHDIRPAAPTHVLIIPRKHIARISEASEQDKELIGHLFVKANEIAVQEGLAQAGYRYVFNCDHPGGQVNCRPPNKCRCK